MIGLDVVCPGCRKVFHETTAAYDPDKPANGAMVRLKDPWRKWGWCSFGDSNNGLPPDIAERADTYWSVMECPACGTPIAPSGHLTVRLPKGQTAKVLDLDLNPVTSDEPVRPVDAPSLPDDVIDPPAFMCDVCGKECKSAAGLGAHMRSHV